MSGPLWDRRRAEQTSSQLQLRRATANAEDVGVTVDLFRRRAANRRSSRFWDRGMWFCGLALALLVLGLGLWSLSATLLGQPVDARVQSCETELQGAGRFVWNATDCEMTTVDVDGQPTTALVETSRNTVQLGVGLGCQGSGWTRTSMLMVALWLGPRRRPLAVCGA
ncbi:protein of unknown function [Blastococcus saxobsidens DD2]|uniref:Uncharacterized protein n=1 Tax=Blastococcus saxobsidens (strain DD2) TaxID=1146883 RepID=H6RVG0_BLASD|nr:protein of unknown function [Blastococcus saxobsidens DD2]